MGAEFSSNTQSNNVYFYGSALEPKTLYCDTATSPFCSIFREGGLIDADRYDSCCEENGMNMFTSKPPPFSALSPMKSCVGYYNSTGAIKCYCHVST